MARRSARQGKQASGLERVETIVNPPTGQSNVEPASLDIHADITPSEDAELLAWLGRQGSSSMPQTQSTEIAVDPIVLARAPSNRDSPRPHYSTSCEKKVFQWINGKCRLVRSGDDDSGHVSLPQNATRIMPPRASKTAYSKTSTFPGLLEQALAVGHQLEMDGHYFATVVLKSSERRPYKSDSVVYQKISHALAGSWDSSAWQARPRLGTRHGGSDEKRAAFVDCSGPSYDRQESLDPASFRLSRTGHKRDELDRVDFQSGHHL